jgi:hypothetical protein
MAATNLHPKLIAVLQELMQQTRQHNLEANRSFCEIHTAEDDHLLAQHRHWWVTYRTTWFLAFDDMSFC